MYLVVFLIITISFILKVRYLKDYKPVDRVVFEFDTFMFLGEIRNIPERMGGMLEEIKLNEEIGFNIDFKKCSSILSQYIYINDFTSQNGKI